MSLFDFFSSLIPDEKSEREEEYRYSKCPWSEDIKYHINSWLEWREKNAVQE